jgi:hypothetical protein
MLGHSDAPCQTPPSWIPAQGITPRTPHVRRHLISERHVTDLTGRSILSRSITCADVALADADALDADR